MHGPPRPPGTGCQNRSVIGSEPVLTGSRNRRCARTRCIASSPGRLAAQPTTTSGCAAASRSRCLISPGCPASWHPYERRRAVRGLDRSRNCNEMCLAPARAVASRLARGQIGNLRSERYPPFQLVLMSRIQSGGGAARTDAEDEEHKPFSHDLPSFPG